MVKELANIHIILTTYCNMGCQGCYQEHLQDKNHLILNEATRNNIRTVYKRFKNDSDKEYEIKVSFFGGEPLLRTDTIIDILQFMKEENLIPDLISIPTSGGQGLILLTEQVPKIKRIINRLFPFVKFTTSLSYDGPNNLKFRNVEPNLIEEGFSFLINNSIEPKFTSCVIPIQNDTYQEELHTNYFLDTYKDVIKRTGLAPTFTIPHLINSKIDYINLDIGLEKLLTYLDIKFVVKPFTHEISYESSRCNTSLIPKLITDVLDKMIKPELGTSKYNWCQAGKNHLTITKDYIMDCEFLSKPAEYNLEALTNWCSGCSIKDLCQRPCLKNMELSEIDQEVKLKRQCDFRKVLVHSIKNQITKNSKNSKI